MTWQNAPRSELQATIANTASLSGNISLDGIVPVGLWTPAAWTAAAITFQMSRDGGATWGDLFDEAGAEVTIPSAAIPTAAARRFALNPRIFLASALLRIRSGTTAGAGPVNQGGDRVITLVVRPL
jgi:hypothetical protein